MISGRLVVESNIIILWSVESQGSDSWSASVLYINCVKNSTSNDWNTEDKTQCQPYSMQVKYGIWNMKSIGEKK
jgi:hypothetical protein